VPTPGIMKSAMIFSSNMAEQKRFTVVELPDLNWPTSLQLPSRRFRLFLAVDQPRQ
jgi:hypothetical protein